MGYIDPIMNDLTPTPAPTAEQLARPIVKGSIVNYKGGHRRVTAKFKNTVNLGPVWGGRNGRSGIVKDIPLSEVFEDGDAQYEAWTQSESYRCM